MKHKSLEKFEPSEGSDTFVVILHAFTGNPEKYKFIKKVVLQEFSTADVWIPILPLTRFSNTHPNRVVADLITDIDEIVEMKATKKVNDYNKIIFVGHSSGTVLCRKLYIIACGENAEAPFEDVFTNREPKKWAWKIDRIIQMGAMNKGWTLSDQLSVFHKILLHLGIVVGNVLTFFGRQLFIFQTRKGSSFITELRLQSLWMYRKAVTKGLGNALVVQLLGSVDDLIAPSDSIDLILAHNFVYLNVPNSGHFNIIVMDDSVAGKKRQAKLVQALTATTRELKALQNFSMENQLPDPVGSVSDVVFVIHGIRDKGFWTQKIAGRVRELGNDRKLRFETETGSYGYFPMLPFLFHAYRRSKVEWFMEQYIENLRQFPNAEFSFVGHSNGTYLLAKALETYPSCKFKHVVFAGSVVKSSYNWNKLIERKQVNKVYNFVASSDWVVAVFTKSFEILGLRDLGSGGHDGFKKLEEDSQLQFIKGGHGTAIREELWDSIATYIVTGKMPELVNFKDNPSTIVKILGFSSPLIFLALIIGVIYLGVVISNSVESEKLKVILVICYYYIIWKIATKV